MTRARISIDPVVCGPPRSLFEVDRRRSAGSIGVCGRLHAAWDCSRCRVMRLLADENVSRLVIERGPSAAARL